MLEVKDSRIEKHTEYLKRYSGIIARVFQVEGVYELWLTQPDVSSSRVITSSDLKAVKTVLSCCTAVAYLTAHRQGNQG